MSDQENSPSADDSQTKDNDQRKESPLQVDSPRESANVEVDPKSRSPSTLDDSQTKDKDPGKESPQQVDSPGVSANVEVDPKSVTPPTAMEAPPTSSREVLRARCIGTPPLLGTTGRLPSITPNMAEFGRIPSAPKNVSCNHKTMPPRDSGKVRTPNQMVKMSTVTMTNRSQRDSAPKQYLTPYLDSRRPRKVITWDEATTSRPPLRIDMEGPTPCSYTPRNKPLNEKNAPAWSFGRKTFVEKQGGARTSWEKTWFQNEDVWTQKADFFSDKRWPAPPTHPQRHSMGTRLAIVPTAPQYTFGFRRQFSVSKQGSEEEPSPNEYNIDKASKAVLMRSPAFSHSFRRGGTTLWSYTETTPGPGTYRPERTTSRIKTHHPAFSIRGIRRQQTHELGPFAAF